MNKRVVLVLGVLIVAILSQTAKWKGAAIQRQPPQANAWVAPGAYRHWELYMRAWQAEQLAKPNTTKYDQPHFLYQPTDVLPEKPMIISKPPTFSTSTAVLTPTAPAPTFVPNGAPKQPTIIKPGEGAPKQPIFVKEPVVEPGAAKDPGFSKTPQIIGSTTSDNWTNPDQWTEEAF